MLSRLQGTSGRLRRSEGWTWLRSIAMIVTCDSTGE